MLTHKYPTEEDHALIQAALLRMLEKSPGPQMKFAEPEVAFEYMREADKAGKLVILDGYAILFDLGSPWYTDKVYFLEELILKIKPTTITRDVVAGYLEVLARKMGCVMSVVGDTQIGMMTPVYEHCGYQRFGSQLVKEIDYGMGP